MLGTKFLDTPNLLINANEKKNIIKKILRQQRELSSFQEAGPALKFASLLDLLRKYLIIHCFVLWSWGCPHSHPALAILTTLWIKPSDDGPGVS